MVGDTAIHLRLTETKSCSLSNFLLEEELIGKDLKSLLETTGSVHGDFLFLVHTLKHKYG